MVLKSSCACAQVQHDVFSNDLPTPTLPPRAKFSPQPSSRAQSTVPTADQQRLSELEALQQQRLQNERQVAAEKEAAARKVSLPHPGKLLRPITTVISRYNATNNARVLARNLECCAPASSAFETPGTQASA